MVLCKATNICIEAQLWFYVKQRIFVLKLILCIINFGFNRKRNIMRQANPTSFRANCIANSKQNNCRTYDNSGLLNYANGYSIREQSHNAWNRSYLHNAQIIFQKFVQEVNSGINFNNKKGMVDAIPIVAYHIITNSLDPSSTDINLFASEMKYLHDNGFKVIPMSDLGYDQTTNMMYIRQ